MVISKDESRPRERKLAQFTLYIYAFWNFYSKNIFIYYLSNKKWLYIKAKYEYIWIFHSFCSIGISNNKKKLPFIKCQGCPRHYISNTIGWLLLVNSHWITKKTFFFFFFFRYFCLSACYLSIQFKLKAAKIMYLPYWYVCGMWVIFSLLTNVYMCIQLLNIIYIIYMTCWQMSIHMYWIFTLILQGKSYNHLHYSL